MNPAESNPPEDRGRSFEASLTQNHVLRQVLDSIAEGVIIADRKGQFLLFNSVAADILGIGMTDTPVQAWTERYGCFLPDGVTPYPPLDLPLARAALRDEQVNDAEVLIRHERRPEGVWLSVNASPLRDENGVSHGGVVAFRDITERKKQEAALRHSLALLEGIASGTTDAIFVKDLKGVYLMINPAGAAFLGKTPEEVVGQDDTTLFSTDTAAAVMLTDRWVLEQEKAFTNEERATAAGVTRTYLATKAPYRDSQGKLLGLIGISRDISDRKEAEAQLHHSEALYHSLVESIPLALYRKDRQGRFTFANQRFCDLVGQTRDQIRGKTDFDFFPPALAEKYVRDDRLVLDSGRIFNDIEENKSLDSGPARYMHVVKSAVRNFDGEIIGTQGLFWDVTEGKLAEDNLKRTATDLLRSNEELQQFAHVVPQSLQEPMRLVVKYCELLKRRYHDKNDHAADEFIDFAVDGARRMDKLIQDLLAYAWIGTKGKAFTPTDCEVIRARVLAALGRSIAESGAVITNDPLPTVLADGTQVEQLFQNLLSNAIKFRGREPLRIHLGAERREQGHWQFSVRDNGIGLDDADQQRIFGVFERLHHDSKYAGNGIGLAICKRIVERHGGTLWVKSRLGEGATFFFTLGA